MARWLLAFMALAWAVAGGPAAAEEKIHVVATFSILADLAKNVGGDRIEVTPLVGADGDVHAYTPSPADAKRLADANVVVLNGLGLEGWMERLVKASGTKAAMAVASTGVKPRQMDEDDGRPHTDPHAWQSVANAKIYVANIRDALVKADPSAKSTYETNASSYLSRLDAMDKEITQSLAAIPAERRKIITTHDAFGYFGAAYRVQFIAPQGVSTETEVSARDVARIIRQIKTQKIPAVFMENISDPRLMERIAKESGAKLGGKVYSDALSPTGGPAATYIDMMRNNLREFLGAFKTS